jgi:hypothetical protein
MTTRPNVFEQFIMLFRELKRIAGKPQRLVSFHDDSSEFQTAIRSLEIFLLRTDLKGRVFAGKKLFPQVPDDFEKEWHEYENEWGPAITHLQWRSISPEIFGHYDPSKAPKTAAIELEAPDPECDSSFNSVWHDGGAAFQLGIDYLEHVYEGRKDGQFEDDERIANWCRIGLDAYDYFANTIGIDVRAAFRRWQLLPPIFMPARVSNKHGNEKGSLNDLLDDAIRAYVCGAPAAAIALCRSSLEVLLNKHYLPNDYQYPDKMTGELKDKSLKDLIVLAEKRYDCWKLARMKPRVKHINDILHDYSRVQRLDPKDDKFLLDYLLTPKSLIESVRQ